MGRDLGFGAGYMESRQVVGWRERIDLPDWGIEQMTAKLDTGARGAALDVAGIEPLGDGRVRFQVILDRGKGTRTHPVEAEIAGETRVRSSNGMTQRRLRVRTRVRLGGVVQEVEFSLVSRKRMIHRVLLGRIFLSPAFLVDSGARFSLGKKRRRKPSSTK